MNVIPKMVKMFKCFVGLRKRGEDGFFDFEECGGIIDKEVVSAISGIEMSSDVGVGLNNWQ